VRDIRAAEFDIQSAGRLLPRQHSWSKKAYCDWDRYKEFKAPCTIGIRAHRNSARTPVGQELGDIRMVVDALDLCYTKRTSIPSSLSAATRTSRRWSASCARTQAGDRRRCEAITSDLLITIVMSSFFTTPGA